MNQIATPQAVTPVRNGLDVTVHILGAGSLTMPRDAAHQLARALMEVIGEIDGIVKRSAGRPWPNLSTKGD